MFLTETRNGLLTEKVSAAATAADTFRRQLLTFDTNSVIGNERK